MATGSKSDTIAKWKLLHLIINGLRQHLNMPLTPDKYPDYDQYGNKIL